MSQFVDVAGLGGRLLQPGAPPIGTDEHADVVPRQPPVAQQSVVVDGVRVVVAAQVDRLSELPQQVPLSVGGQAQEVVSVLVGRLVSVVVLRMSPAAVPEDRPRHAAPANAALTPRPHPTAAPLCVTATAASSQLLINSPFWTDTHADDFL